MIDDLRHTQPVQPRWQGWLIDPLQEIDDPIELSQNRRLTFYLFVLAVGTVINFLIWRVLGDIDLFTTLGMVLSVMLYGMVRILHHKAVALVTVLMTIALPFILLIFDPANFNMTNGLFLVALALLTSSQFLSLKSNLQLAIVMIVIILILNLSITQRDNGSFLGVFVPMIFLLTLNLLNAHGHEMARQKPSQDTDTAFHLLPDAVIIHNDQHVLDCNESASCLLGIAYEQLIGREITDFITIHSSTNTTRIVPGRHLTIRYKDVLQTGTQRESVPVKVTARSIPYGGQLATMMILQPYEVDSQTTFHHVAGLVADYAYALTLNNQGIGGMSWCTDRMKALLAHKDTPLPYEAWLAQIHPHDRDEYNAHLTRVQVGETHTLEYRLKGVDDSWLWMHDTAHLLIDPDSGQATQIVGMSYDISQRVETEKTLEIHIVQQAVIAELGLLALNSNDLSEMIDYVAVLCEQVLDLSFVAVFEHQITGKQFRCKGFSRSTPDLLQVDSTLDDAPDKSLMGYTLHMQEAVISVDLVNESRFRPLSILVNAGYHSGAGIIILGQSYVPYGVLAVFKQVRHDFTYDEIYFLQAVANVLGTFIERHRAQQAELEQAEFAEALRDATAAINSQLELREVLTKIIIYLQQVIPQTERAAIVLKDYEIEQYRYHTTWNFPPGDDYQEVAFYFEIDKFPLLRYMYEVGQPVIVDDTQQDPRWVERKRIADTRAYLGAPVIVQGDCVGFINLHSFHVGAFDEADAQRLQTFAETIGTAIVNARKQDYLEREVLARTTEVNQQREQLATILSGTGDGIFYTENQLIAFANPTLCAITGYSVDELQDQPATLLFPETSSEQELETVREMKESLKNKEVWRGKGRIRRKDNHTVEVGLTVSEINTSDTSVSRAVIIVRDIRKEQELEQLQKQFIAAAAHDLRSPIASLLTRMHMIRRDPEHMDQHMKRLDYVIGRMNRLVNDLIDANGRITLHPQTMILQDILGQVTGLLSTEAEEKGLTFSYHASDDPILVLADPHRLEQVFVNLIVNAIHYTEQGTVRVRCQLEADGTHVKVSVQDTGIGIPNDEQNNIFLPFYRTRENRSKGNGLGLSITKEIVELHNGTIQLISTPGEGSTFCVCLPVVINRET
ncbi:MAG: ATP-binding protein [Anaerolineae bacterium]